MSKTTLSPEFNVAIPKAICSALKLKPGNVLDVSQSDGRIELRPVRPVKEMRGFLRGIDTSAPREKEDRL